MFDDVFQVIYFIEFVVISLVRVAHTRKYRRLEFSINLRTLPDVIMLALVGIVMVLQLIYLFTLLLDFANYSLPSWAGWLGVLAFAAAIWLLWRSHIALGKNWTPTLGIRDNHRLITDGVFKYVRHPMYGAHILWGVASALMLQNWIAGFGFLVATIVQSLSRVNAEERMMLEHFGARYEAYMQRTGCIIPRIGS
jgi:protein-S-isoprenylcysteine O-methyltransferase Ste14